MRSAFVAGALMVLVAARAGGQSPAAGKPRFEVASVKPGISPAAAARAAASSGGTFTFPFVGVRVQPGGRLIANTTLQGLILRAYGIRGYQLEGGPAWLTSDYFDLAAKAESESATEAEMNEMLKALLAERFGLRVHVETRQAPVYTLKARADGRLGPGLKRTSAECERDLAERKTAGTAPRLPSPQPADSPPKIEPVCGRTMGMMNARSGTETYASGGRPFSELVSKLSGDLQSPVIDQTGLTGLFDVLLEFESTRRIGNLPPPGLDPNSTEPLPVPLPAALQQQLGLTLEKGPGPLPFTIVDAAEPPSPN